MEFLPIFIAVLSFGLYVLAADDDNPDNIPPQLSRMPACDDLVKILRGQTIQAPKQTYTLGGLLGEGARSCVFEGETGWAFKKVWAVKIAPFQVQDDKVRNDRMVLISIRRKQPEAEVFDVEEFGEAQFNGLLYSYYVMTRAKSTIENALRTEPRSNVEYELETSPIAAALLGYLEIFIVQSFHRAGCVNHDLHLGNIFLMENDKILAGDFSEGECLYTLDQLKPALKKEIIDQAKKKLDGIRRDKFKDTFNAYLTTIEEMAESTIEGIENMFDVTNLDYTDIGIVYEEMIYSELQDGIPVFDSNKEEELLKERTRDLIAKIVQRKATEEET